MEKQVILTVKASQDTGDGQPEVIELVTQGIFKSEQDGHYQLTYEETELTGLTGTTTTFTIEPGVVTLLRTGSFNSQMVFQLGQRHLSLYETPYGGISIGVHTQKIHSTLTEAGGLLEIDYAIEIDHGVAGHNQFSIIVKP